VEEEIRPGRLFTKFLGFLIASSFLKSHRPFFEEGLAAYAAGDYVKATHVLIPQVDNSLRELLKLLDLPTTTNDDEGCFELKNMNHVLHDEVMQATRDERLWGFLKVLYTDSLPSPGLTVDGCTLPKRSERRQFPRRRTPTRRAWSCAGRYLPCVESDLVI
jgi:hypothetical protein